MSNFDYKPIIDSLGSLSSRLSQQMQLIQELQRRSNYDAVIEELKNEISELKTEVQNLKVQENGENQLG